MYFFIDTGAYNDYSTDVALSACAYNLNFNICHNF